MTEQRDSAAVQVAEILDDLDVEADPPRVPQKEAQAVRRAKAVSLRLAGLSYTKIGEQLGVTSDAARKIVQRSLEAAENHNADEMRTLENERLDRAQAAIWSRVLQGDNQAIDVFLRISGQRAKLNGLYAPTKIDLNVSVRREMEEAFAELEELVLEAEVVEEGTSNDADE